MHRKGRIIIGLVVALVASTTFAAAPAAARGLPFEYPYSDCIWPGDRIDVFVDSRFPSDRIRDNVMNSFRNRIRDGINQWNSALSGMGDSRRLNYVEGRRPPGRIGISISYRDYGDETEDLARAPAIGNCTYQSSGIRNYSMVSIDVQVRDDWFTQENNRRAHWERCDDSAYTFGSQYAQRKFLRDNYYTCLKVYDFGSAVTHELGHALGFHHPDNIGASGKEAAGQFDAAGCEKPLGPDKHAEDRSQETRSPTLGNMEQSTMCPNLYRHKTDMRTVSQWDRDLTETHYRWAGPNRYHSNGQNAAPTDTLLSLIGF